MNIKAKQKWLELQSWEDRNGCVVASLLEVSDMKEHCGIQGEFTDAELFSALADVAVIYESTLMTLEKEMFRVALEDLRQQRAES
jgi:hypothetical protein